MADNNAHLDEEQQNLDDMTVLQNVADQSLGQAVLNVARPTDVSTSELGKLAEIIPGSAGDHGSLTPTGITTTVADVAIDHTLKADPIAPIDTIAGASTGDLPVETISAPGIALSGSEAVAAPTQAPTEVVAEAAATIQVAAATVPGVTATQVVSGPVATDQVVSGPAAVQEIKVNHAPIIDGETDAVTATDHTGATGRITAHDPDGDAITFHLVDPVTGAQVDTITVETGTVTINPGTGEYTFTPNADQVHLGVGEVSLTDFKAVVVDSNGAVSSPIDVSVTVTGSNDGPVVTSTHDLNATDHTGSSNFVTGSDLDTGDTLSYHLVDSNGNQVDSVVTEHGTVSINSQTGEYTFTPTDASLNAGARVTDHFSVAVVDNHGASSTSEVSVNILGTNDGATITGTTTASVTEDGVQQVAGALTVSDVDSGEAHTIAATQQGNFGTFGIDANGQWSYSLDNASVQGLAEGESLTETFTIQSQDGTATDTITVTINGTNDTPTISATNLASTDYGSVSDTATFTDVDVNDTHTFSLVDANGNLVDSITTDHGVVTIDPATGHYTFTATDATMTGGEKALDTFTVQVNDNHGASASQVVSVDLTGTNGSATITGTASGMVSEDGSIVGGQMAVHDVDHGEAVFQASTVHTAEGTFTMGADGQWDFAVNNDAVQGLAVGESTTKTFEVKSADGTATQEVTVTITGSNDGPVVTHSDATLTSTDVGTASGQITASDVDHGDTLTYHLRDAYGNLVDTLATDHGTVTINPQTGEYTFTAAASDRPMGVGDIAQDTFKVVGIDNHGAQTDPQTVGVTITGTNDVPTISATQMVTDDHTGVSGVATGLDINANDHLTYSLVDSHGNQVTSLATDHGTVSIDATTGHYTFMPSDATISMDAGTVAHDTFIVQVSDGQGGTASTNVGVEIDGTNQSATMGGTVVGSVTEDGTLRATGTVTVTDVDTGESHTQVVSQSGNHGSFSINANGQWSYSLNDNDSSVQALGVGETMTETFRVRSQDGTAFEDVKVTINGTNDAPIVGQPIVLPAGQEDHSMVFTKDQLLSNAHDIDIHDTLSVTGVTASNGTLVDNHNGTWTFTPTDSFSGTAILNYSVSDGHTTTHDSASVSVVHVNHAPVIDVEQSTLNLKVETSRETTTEIYYGSSKEQEEQRQHREEQKHEEHDRREHERDDKEGHDEEHAKAERDGREDDGKQHEYSDHSEKGHHKHEYSDGNDHNETRDVDGQVTESHVTATGHISATDQDGDHLTYTVDNGEHHHGTMSFDQNGNYTYTSTDENWSGKDTFSISVSDGHGGVAHQDITVDTTLTVENTAIHNFHDGDGTWSGGFMSQNVGDPGHYGTNELFPIAGTEINVNTFKGVEGSYNILNMGDGNESFFLDDSYSKGDASHARMSNIQEIDLGAGHQVVDLTSTQWGVGDTVFRAGEGTQVILGSGGNDTFYAGEGDEHLWGGGGNDLFDFADNRSGNDHNWTAVVDGGVGQNTIHMDVDQTWTVDYDNGKHVTVNGHENQHGEVDTHGAAGTVHMHDGSEIHFQNITKLDY